MQAVGSFPSLVLVTEFSSEYFLHHIHLRFVYFNRIPLISFISAFPLQKHKNTFKNITGNARFPRIVMHCFWNNLFFGLLIFCTLQFFRGLFDPLSLDIYIFSSFKVHLCVKICGIEDAFFFQFILNTAQKLLFANIFSLKVLFFKVFSDLGFYKM